MAGVTGIRFYIFFIEERIMEKNVSQLTDAEALGKIVDVVTAGGFGLKNIGMSGQFADYDGKTRRHFNVEVTLDTPEVTS
jgi:hypothetical protein